MTDNELRTAFLDWYLARFHREADMTKEKDAMAWAAYQAGARRIEAVATNAFLKGIVKS